MSDKNPLTELLRPHVKDIERAVAAGDQMAVKIVTWYEMHRRCPGDPGAPVVCAQLLNEWLAQRKQYS